MKNEQADERIVKLLDGRSLSVGKIRAFSDEEAEEAIRSILKEKAKGMSVRKAILQIAGGDDKLTLRLQNKYRNTLKKTPEKIEALERELFGEVSQKTKNARGRVAMNKSVLPILRGEEGRELMQKRLEREINALYDRLAQALKVENERLRVENAALKSALDKDDQTQA